MILVDSNVWIDLIRKDPVWFEWSSQQIERAYFADQVVTNPVIYAELAPIYDSPQELVDFFQSGETPVAPFSPACCYVAGRAFLKYRQSRGGKTGVLPDFFIGAQAQTEGWIILTRDKARYKTYFPKVKLICP